MSGCKHDSVFCEACAKELRTALSRSQAREKALREALKTALIVIGDVPPEEFRNGNTSEGGTIDEGEVMTFRFIERAEKLLASTTEEGET